MGNKKKQRPHHTPPDRKSKVVPSSAVPPGVHNSGERLCWRFKHVDHDSRWRFDEGMSEQWRELMTKMAHCESMTVHELRNSSRFFKEYDLPSGLLQEALDRLTTLRLDEMTKIQRFEFTGTQRLYGFLHDNVFHVIWWDPHHEIFPSKLKNT
ncbi:hypothetical protein [Saccharomonospora iraqiensis]|uniref:hypothetical protein n=1 Tax=Saccharomonospora iraqiensis TaxID=52698 RepID=UPI00022DFC67|nr:hypothetical protein [Saccharomonospora iraqiensis]